MKDRQCLHDSQVTELLLVARNLPFTVLDHVVDLVVNVRSGLDNVVHGQLVERSGALNILQSGLQLFDLLQNRLLGQLGVLNGLLLEDVNSLQSLGHIVSDWLESLDSLLNLINNALVLQHLSVVSKVNVEGLTGQFKVLLLGLVVSLLESSQAGRSLASQSQGRDDVSPVQLGSSALSNRHGYF